MLSKRQINNEIKTFILLYKAVHKLSVGIDGFFTSLWVNFNTNEPSCDNF